MADEVTTNEVSTDLKKFKKKVIIFVIVAVACLGLALGSLALSDKIEDGSVFIFAAIVLALAGVIFMVLFVLKLIDYKRLKKGKAIDGSDDPKLKTKIIAFGISAVVCLGLIVFGIFVLGGDLDIGIDNEEIIVFACLGVGFIGIVTFLILFIKTINKFKRFKKNK